MKIPLICLLVVVLLPVNLYSQYVQEEWSIRYNGPGNIYDGIADVVVDAEGNAYVTGYSYVDDSYSGKRDAVTIKYSPILYLHANPGTTEYHPGDILGFTVELTSNSDSTLAFEVWTEVETPLGENLSPHLGPSNISLDAQQELSRTVRQRIPLQTPSGKTYTYRVKAGTYPGSVIAEDEYDFLVLPREER